MVVIWSQAAPLASNQPNTFSVLNVKISIDQQQRNPEYSLDHSKKKKNSKNYHPAFKNEHHRIRTWREPALWLGWGSWNASCSLLNCSMRSQALTVLMLIVPQIILPTMPSYISWQVDPSLRASLLMVKMSAKVVDPFWRKNLVIFA